MMRQSTDSAEAAKEEGRGRPSRKAKATRRDKSDDVIATVAKVEEVVEKRRLKLSM